MKYVKMLGLAAVAVAALMAFVGASSASASVLCKTTPPSGICPANQAYPAGTEIHAVNQEKVVLHAEFGTLECEESTVSGTTEKEGSATETVKGNVTVLTFAKCNCEVKVLKNGSLEIHAEDDDGNGTLTANGQEVTTTCSTIFGNVHCIYVTENSNLGTVKGGNPAVFTGTPTISRKPTNALCSPQATWTANYKITSPTPLWVATST